MWGDGDEGVFGVVLAEGFCICDINRSRIACEIAKFGGEKVRPVGEEIALRKHTTIDVSLRFTFKIINLRLEFLFPWSMVSEGRHDLVVATTPMRSMCLVLLECGQQGSKVDAGYGYHMRRVLQCY
jgi:hypothetical protein